MNESTNEADSDSLWPQVRGTLISWGIPLVASSIPYLSWLDGIVDFFRKIGWRFVVVLFSFMVFIVTRLFVIWIGAVRRERAAIKKLNEDYHQYLKSIDGQGYSVDTRNGQPVCPKCDKDGHLTYMSRIDEKNAPPRLYCYACKTSVWKDGNFPRKERKQYEYIP